jgi:uncharacterized protein YjiS (DUF1127 family)
MSALVYSHLRNPQDIPDPENARRMTFVGAVLAFVRHWRSRRQQRQTFAALDSRDLRDLGLSRWDVEHEIARPFWRD